MDTAVVSVPCRKASDYIFMKMSTIRKKCKPEQKYKWIASKTDPDGRQLTIKWEPIGKYSGQSYAKIDFHLKHHETWNQFKEWLKTYTGPHFESVMDGKITRLDLGVNIPVPYQVFRDKVVFDAKQVSCKIKSAKETIYAGSKTSDSQIVLYENEEEIARLEVRYRKNAVPIVSLNDMERVIFLYPFSQVHLCEIDITKTVRPEHHSLISGFRDAAVATSVFDAFTRFNDGEARTRRLLKGYLIEVNTDIIPNAWNHLLERFFERTIVGQQFHKAEFLRRTPPRPQAPYSKFCSLCPEYDGLSLGPIESPKVSFDEVSGYNEFHAKFGDQSFSLLEGFLKTAVDDMSSRAKILRDILDGDSHENK